MTTKPPKLHTSAKKPPVPLKLVFSDGGEFYFTRPYVMGIVNVTPDSFSDGGLFQKDVPFFRQIERMLLFGVDIIDLGGESTRPGALPVPLKEERRRIMPKLKKLRKRYPDLRLSIDTNKVEVAAEAIDHGVDMINDISAGDASQNRMLELAVTADTPIVLMHKCGEPATMQNNVRYADVSAEVYAYLAKKLKILKRLGMTKHKTMIDPGIGFGKEAEHNIALLNKLKHFKRLKQPILIGASMKQLVTQLTECRPDERLAGTIAIHLASLMRGANMVRVHDVQAARHSIDSFFPILGASSGEQAHSIYR